jgi:hypothetical protein
MKRPPSLTPTIGEVAEIANEEVVVARSHHRSRGTAATHLDLLKIYPCKPRALFQTTSETPETLQLNLQTTPAPFLRHLRLATPLEKVPDRPSKAVETLKLLFTHERGKEGGK